MTRLHLTLVLGKTKVVKVLEAGNRLNHLGNPSTNLEDVLCESVAFVASCYGQKCEACETMKDVRYKVWVSKTGRKSACLLPKLKAIPPTLEAFKESTKRAHFQAWIWKANLDEEPPNLNPLKFGWVKDDRCGCASGQLPCCSLVCKCGGSDSCCNRMTKNNMANDANDDEEHSDDEDDEDEDDD